ncbi:hypothetical protein [Streptomyces formicae]|nr:hypothetical protein [Streptomyces formicae]
MPSFATASIGRCVGFDKRSDNKGPEPEGLTDVAHSARRATW